MKYYFSLDRMLERDTAIIRGGKPIPVILFEETPEIKDDAFNNDLSDWWHVYRIGDPSYVAGDFDSKEEALSAYYAAESERIYCQIHDC